MGRLRNWFNFPEPNQPGRQLTPTNKPSASPRTEPVDPAWEQLQRELAAASAEPTGRGEEPMVGAAMSAVVVWMRTAYEDGQLDAIWQCRLRYGYGVDHDNETQSDWFWFNAYPALAALKTGRRDHPLVATCCGLADQAADRKSPEQARAQDEFEQLYHRG